MKVNIADRISGIRTDDEFRLLASEILMHQLNCNPVYKEFAERVGYTKPAPAFLPAFLPIELFKYHRVSCEATQQVTFKSSGITGSTRSLHFVFDAWLYTRLSMQHFEAIYGSLKDWVVLALLPSYIENGESSLVFMSDRFIEASGNPASGFVLNEPERLQDLLEELKQNHTKTLLLGVSYALLDFAEKHPVAFPELTVMETGGMKGRRRELTREELHTALKTGFPLSPVHSEYGMTELLSQAYSVDGKWFTPPPWMKCFITEVSDPLQILPPGRRGLLAFADLANIHSCSFIQTRDLGIVDESGRFTVEGRLDNSDMRGCNLLYT